MPALRTLDLQSHSASSRFHVSQHGLGSGTSRIDEHGYSSGGGHQLTQEFQPLRRQVNRKKIDACQVSARPSEAGDKAAFDRIGTGQEDDGNRRGYRLGGGRRYSCAGRGDNGDLFTNQFGRQRRHSVDLILGPTVFDRHVLALDIAGLFQSLAKCAQKVHVRVRR